MARCDIIIPVWNLWDVTRECVDSLERHTGYPYRLIVIDNCSDSPTREYLEGLKGHIKGMILIRNSENLGFVKAINQGIAVADSEYLCILNNDTVLTRGWLEEMVAVMEHNPSIGLLNPSSNTSGQFPGDMGIDEYAESLKRYTGQIQELYTARGFCMLIQREVIQALGMLDEIYHMGYFDDTDYCKRAQVAGFRTARAKAAYVYHRENRSFVLRQDNRDLFKKNEKIFFSRWGRPLRVGYFMPDTGTPKQRNRIDELAIEVARSGHQIILFLERGKEWPVHLDHFDIRRSDVDLFFYIFVCLYKIVKMKKKKPLHILVTDDPFFGNLLRWFRVFHRSVILISPDTGELLSVLSAKSKEQEA